ncbi:zinc finger and BTB domain-containing protein 16 [Lampris incognitus]|uniref:zinc finger and BTB domain-containing protein 16 n=1 Tax=Lampris incognitus TaxID=2546036 RepID=UPI0024B529F7|nr:zinc finger and BTB domain-containing protein 16 [Lampris incognitus]
MIRINNTQYCHFLQQADALRHSGSLCDAIISVKSQTFRAHRLVLACASRRLAQQLIQTDKESPLHCSLELSSPHTFQQVLDFAYTQALEVPVDDLHLLLRAAQLLEMQVLEDQCQQQLDTLDLRASEKGEMRKVAELSEAIETTAEEDREGRECPVQIEAANNSHVRNESPLPDTAEGNSSPPARQKTGKVSGTSATPCTRDSVITSLSTSYSSLSSPWALPMNKWYPVNSLWMAQNYSNLMATQSLQSSQQMVAHPFPLSASHVYPLLASSFPSPVHSSVVGYTNLHHSLTQRLFTESREMGGIVKQGRLKRKNATCEALIGSIPASKQRYPEGHKAKAASSPDCQHCHTSLRGNPWLQRSKAAPHAGACRFCGRGVRVEHNVQSQRTDHGAEKPYQCKHCPKRFSLKHQLYTHHRVHTGEKPFECRLCGQRSRDYSAMIKHLRTHGGAAPYQCTVCLEFCSSLVAMQRHVKSHPVKDFPPNWSIKSTYLYTSHI